MLDLDYRLTPHNEVSAQALVPRGQNLELVLAPRSGTFVVACRFAPSSFLTHHRVPLKEVPESELFELKSRR